LTGICSFWDNLAIVSTIWGCRF